MSLFGTGEPKIIGTGDPDTYTVLISGGEIVEPGWAIPDVIEQVAPITGFRTFLQGGNAPAGGSNYSEFTVMVRLFDTAKYNSATRASKITELKRYVQKYVYFYPYGQHPIKNNAGTSIRCFMTWQFGIHDANPRFDVLYLTFKSEDYTDATKSIYSV